MHHQGFLKLLVLHSKTLKYLVDYLETQHLPLFFSDLPVLVLLEIFQELSIRESRLTTFSEMSYVSCNISHTF